MKQAIRKHSLAIRWLHWVNFPLLSVMIWSGLLIYWANDVYSISIAGKPFISFFPQGFYEALNLQYRLAEGMAFHFVFMWLFIVNGILYVLYTVFSGEWRGLLPGKHSFREAWLVLLHDLRIRRTQPAAAKYNAAQKIAYTCIILFGAGSTLTGFAIYKPVQLDWLCRLCGGYQWARAEHFILTIGYCLFFMVHLLQVVRAGWNNFQSMITGIEIKKITEDPAPAPVPEQNNPS